jgi:hypothetical protein
MCLHFLFQHEAILAAPIMLVNQNASRVVHLISFRLRDKELYTVWRCVLFLIFLPSSIPAVSLASPKARPRYNKVASISIHPNKRQQRRLSTTSLGHQPYMVPTISQLQPRQMLRRESLLPLLCSGHNLEISFCIQTCLY